MSFTTVTAHRVVAAPEVLDRAVWPEWSDVLRLAPDEALVIHEVGADVVTPIVDDPFAIIELEAGFGETWWDPGGFETRVAPHIDWALPTERPALAQGLVAGVPCKVVFEPEGGVRLLCLTAQVHELEGRL